MIVKDDGLGSRNRAKLVVVLLLVILGCGHADEQNNLTDVTSFRIVIKHGSGDETIVFQKPCRWKSEIKQPRRHTRCFVFDGNTLWAWQITDRGEITGVSK
jgi:hypothetical protein